MITIIAVIITISRRKVKENIEKWKAKD